jgi:hypothetical protein
MSNTLEALESRRLLSVTLQNGLLRIVGTAGDDLIKVKHPLNDTGTRWDQTRTIVEINGEQSFFRTGQIRKLIINGREGNDQF